MGNADKADSSRRVGNRTMNHSRSAKHAGAGHTSTIWLIEDQRFNNKSLVFSTELRVRTVRKYLPNVRNT